MEGTEHFEKNLLNEFKDIRQHRQPEHSVQEDAPRIRESAEYVDVEVDVVVEETDVGKHFL